MIGLAVEGADLIEGWVKAALAVSEPGFANDHVTIVASGAWTETPVALRALDAQAKLVKTDRPSSVANVLCPSPVLRAVGNTQDKIARGWDFLGRGRQHGIKYSGWRDTYFERLTGHRANKAGDYQGLQRK
jgi:hypothetical protein